MNELNSMFVCSNVSCNHWNVHLIVYCTIYNPDPSPLITAICWYPVWSHTYIYLNDTAAHSWLYRDVTEWRFFHYKRSLAEQRPRVTTSFNWLYHFVRLQATKSCVQDWNMQSQNWMILQQTQANSWGLRVLLWTWKLPPATPTKLVIWESITFTKHISWSSS